jgi:diacylglycerol kinase (ATP)
MKSNLKMTQPSKAQASAVSFVSSQEPFTSSSYHDANHLRREYAWQVATNLIVSFQYAWAGVQYAFVTQRNFRIHTFIGFCAISLAIGLKISAVGISIITLTSALVMVLELLNTALESIVDLTVGQTYHDLAKIAKDCAAGAVLISALAAVLVASFIILPPLLTLLFSPF